MDANDQESDSEGEDKDINQFHADCKNSDYLLLGGTVRLSGAIQIVVGFRLVWAKAHSAYTPNNLALKCEVIYTRLRLIRAGLFFYLKFAYR
ncbi:MAG: hypothetical protein C0490_00085, partial [Marivirga sp.]|nr:hypothetical protein [Marivirga sp.]